MALFGFRKKKKSFTKIFDVSKHMEMALQEISERVQRELRREQRAIETEKGILNEINYVWQEVNRLEQIAKHMIELESAMEKGGQALYKTLWRKGQRYPKLLEELARAYEDAQKIESRVEHLLKVADELEKGFQFEKTREKIIIKELKKLKEKLDLIRDVILKTRRE